ncbi:hypothetical protein BGW80DRAFT_1463207 [Lactifluus volemus]|nr:hypothetical protein BGW80DRAFT_1463207 [Lactifluus volemus]
MSHQQTTDYLHAGGTGVTTAVPTGADNRSYKTSYNRDGNTVPYSLTAHLQTNYDGSSSSPQHHNHGLPQAEISAPTALLTVNTHFTDPTSSRNYRSPESTLTVVPMTASQELANAFGGMPSSSTGVHDSHSALGHTPITPLLPRMHKTREKRFSKSESPVPTLQSYVPLKGGTQSPSNKYAFAIEGVHLP